MLINKENQIIWENKLIQKPFDKCSKKMHQWKLNEDFEPSNDCFIQKKCGFSSIFWKILRNQSET